MKRFECGDSRNEGTGCGARISGPIPGTPGRVGAVARRNAAWRRGGRPKPQRSGRPAVGHQWRIQSCLSSRAFAEQASNTARGTPEGPADLRHYPIRKPWRREMPGPVGLSARGVPRPSDFLSFQDR